MAKVNPVTAAVTAAVLTLGGVQVSDMAQADNEKSKIVKEYKKEQDSLLKIRAVVMKEKFIPSKTIIDSITAKGDTLKSTSPSRIEPIMRKVKNYWYLSVEGDTIFSSHILRRDGVDTVLADIITVPSAGLDFATKNIMLDME